MQNRTSGRHEKPLIEELDKTRDVTKPKSGAPSVDEWQDFIGRIVLRTSLEAYMGWVLKDIDLSAEEMDQVALTKQDLKEMSTPIAVFTSKNSWAKKHGREIISATDSIESILSISIWMRRVHRIARKHRPEKQAARKPRSNPAMRASQSQSQSVQQPVVQPAAQLQGEELARMSASHIAQQVPSPVYERIPSNGHLGQAESEGPVKKPFPPDLGRFTGNPGTG